MNRAHYSNGIDRYELEPIRQDDNRPVIHDLCDGCAAQFNPALCVTLPGCDRQPGYRNGGIWIEQPK